ncbi:MAG: hypothetical protein AAF329_23955 [Cyanobacteria bacterium P01_A01_bin.17]
MNDDQLFPNWLYPDLIEDALPWEKKTNLTLETFVERYTLHDSYWVGIFHHVAYDPSVTLAFQWDSVWLPNEASHSDAGDSPYLFMRLEEVTEVTTANYENLDGICRAISGLEMLELEGALHLAIDDVYGGQVNIVFTGNHSILALNSEGKVLSI